jgi:type IV pilus assembly protein PilQ
MDDAMQMTQRPLTTAFRAIVLAIGIPAVICMFGMVRSRQLQSTANPRWARFASGTGRQATKTGPTRESGRLLVRTASIQIDEGPPPAPTATRTGMTEPGLTGSVTGQSSIEAPVQAPPLPPVVADVPPVAPPRDPHERRTIIFRPVDEEPDRVKPAPTVQFESRLMDVQRRLDHLANRQHEQRAHDIARDSQILEALKKLNEPYPGKAPAHASTAEQPVEPESAVAEPVLSPAPPAPSAGAVRQHPVEQFADVPSASRPTSQSAAPTTMPIPEPLPISVCPPVESPIRIRRGSGPDAADTFSMDVHDGDIRELFGSLSELAHVSILLGPDVGGQVSLSLHDVRFEAAFAAILKSNNLAHERDGDIIIIRTEDNVARLKQQHRQLITRIYQPDYLSAAELHRLVEPILSGDGRHSFTASGRPGALRSGDATVDDDVTQREAVVVQDTAEVLGQIDQILVDMDVAPLQVGIQAKILCVRLSDRMPHGVDLERLPCQRGPSATFAEGGLTHGNLSCSVPVFIKSIERFAETGVVTSQQIQVLNKHRAEMLIGGRVGYPTRAGVEFLETETRLIFRPSISADGFVRLEIHPERSTTSVNRRTGMPRQNTAELTTRIIVRDGATVAIGGLISEEVIESTKSTPLIGSIPVVGIPFRSRQERLQRTELIILVTPHIITDAMATELAQPAEQSISASTGPVRGPQAMSSRSHLARAHYDRARTHVRQGNLVKARQQVDASLRQNTRDADAVQLRTEINQCLLQGPAK